MFFLCLKLLSVLACMSKVWGELEYWISWILCYSFKGISLSLQPIRYKKDWYAQHIVAKMKISISNGWSYCTLKCACLTHHSSKGNKTDEEPQQFFLRSWFQRWCLLQLRSGCPFSQCSNRALGSHKAILSCGYEIRMLTNKNSSRTNTNEITLRRP